MYGQSFFEQAIIYLLAAVIAVPVAKRLGLGSVLGYLIAGMVVGPFGLHLVGQEGEDVMHFAEFGVVMMLFLVGLELHPSLLWRMKRALFGLGGAQVGITMAVITSLSIGFGLSWQAALAVGMTLALSSTAIVLQTLNEKNLTRTDAGQAAFGVLLFQDLAVIPMLALLPLLATQAMHHTGHGESDSWVVGLPALLQTLVVLGVLGGIILAGQFLLRYVFRYIAAAQLREIFTAAALLLVIGVAVLMDRIGLSPALGTFLAGVVLANNEYRHELESDIDPFKGLLLGVFFIAVGASIDFGLVWREPGLIFGLVALLFVVKFAVLFVCGRFFRMGLDQNLLFAFALAQGGEFAYVLFSFASQAGVVSAEVTSPLIAVVAISMGLTPVLLLLNEKFIQPYAGTKRTADVREADAPEREAPVIIAGFSGLGSTVGRLLWANGAKATVFESDADRVELLRKLDFKVYYGDASRHDLLAAAGAEYASVVVIALDDHSTIMKMVTTVQKYYPHLTILARAAGQFEAYDLVNAGVDRVYRETFDTGLQMGVDTLRALGFRGYQAHRAAKMFRRHDEVMLRDLAAQRDDDEYFTTARARIHGLEKIMLGELRDPDEDRDAAWDTVTLREEFGGSSGGS